MFEKDSPQDLLLRGFSREYILDKTGTDVGYHGNAMKAELKGIDRVAYKVGFVESNYTHDEIVAVLDEYAEGIDAATVLNRLGLAGVNIIKLNVLMILRISLLLVTLMQLSHVHLIRISRFTVKMELRI